ncbi:SUN domain-containing protein 2-like [Wolffia australiana]
MPCMLSLTWTTKVATNPPSWSRVELKKLEWRTQTRENSLTSINQDGLTSKEEIRELLLGFENYEERDVVELEEMRGYIREVVLKELVKHEVDGLGRVDYALEGAAPWSFTTPRRPMGGIAYGG